MKISLALLGLVTAAACAALPSESELLDNYESSDLDVEYIFNGTLEKGGPVVEYTGATVEDIEAQVKKDYPDLSVYTAPYVEDGHSKRDDGPAALAEKQLNKRYQAWSTCITYWGYGDGGEMNGLVNRLYGISTSSFLVQPRRCISLGCNKGAGAGLCNDQYNIAQRFSGRFAAPHLAHLSRDSCWWLGRLCGGKGRTPSHICNIAVSGQRFFNYNKNNVIAGSCGAFKNEWSVNGGG